MDEMGFFRRDSYPAQPPPPRNLDAAIAIVVARYPDARAAERPGGWKIEASRFVRWSDVEEDHLDQCDFVPIAEGRTRKEAWQAAAASVLDADWRSTGRGMLWIRLTPEQCAWLAGLSKTTP